MFSVKDQQYSLYLCVHSLITVNINNNFSIVKFLKLKAGSKCQYFS